MADFELIQIGNGFEIRSSKGQTDGALKVIWERVTEVNAFKRDLWSTDQICVAFTMDDGTIVEINEEMKGFTQLCEFLPEFLPSALPFGDWHQNIMVPAFEPCPTKIFSVGLTSKEDIS